MVDLPDASGPLSLAESYMFATLADADAFRTWAGVETQAAALEHIHLEALPEAKGQEYSLEELSSYRPFAIVWAESSDALLMVRDAVSGAAFEYVASGRIGVYFEQATPPTYGPGPLARTVKNSIGDIVDDVLALSGSAGYLAIRSLKVTGPHRSDLAADPAQDDALAWYFDIAWGRAG